MLSARFELAIFRVSGDRTYLQPCIFEFSHGKKSFFACKFDTTARKNQSLLQSFREMPPFKVPVVIANRSSVRTTGLSFENRTLEDIVENGMFPLESIPENENMEKEN